MLIVVDEDIANAREVFGRLGEVRTVAGRTLQPADLAGADALVIRSVTRVDAALLAGSTVRFVGTVTTGVDHVDTDWLAGRSISFASAAGCNSRPVAEYVLAVLLLLAERSGFDPAAKTLGVIGVGRIGSIVARWAELLGLRVMRCDPPLQRLRPDGGYVDFAMLATEADIVTLHVPLTREGPDRTCGMVDEKWLTSLKTRAILINSSRGEVVHEDVLRAAIDVGRLHSATLDVWRGEPLINADLARRAAVATPHIAGYSVESRQRAVGMVFEALARFAGVTASPPPTPRTTLTDIAMSPGEGPLAVLRRAVLHASNIEAVDARLRRSLDDPARAAAFDELRRACAARHEFAAYRLTGTGEAAGRLPAQFGFTIG